MYYEGKKKEEVKRKPFTIICNNCGSDNVTATAYEYRDLGITCKDCGAHLSYGSCYGSYNEREYHED